MLFRSKRLAKKELDGIDHPNRPGMLELATRKASELISSIDVRSIVRFSTLQWELGILGLVLSISAILGLASPEHARHWARRLYGLSDAPWPRRTALNIVGLELDIPSFTNKPNRERYQVALKDGKLLAPKGSSARLRATAKDLLGAPYDTCSFHYRDRSGNRGRATMLSYSEGNPKEFLLDGPPLVAVTDDLWFSLVGEIGRAHV